MPILLRLFVMVVALQVFIDVVAFLAFLALDGTARIVVLAIALALTLIWDGVALVYLILRNLGPLTPFQARMYRGGLFSATFAALLTVAVLLILLVPLGLNYWWVWWILFIGLIVIFVQDVYTSFYAIR